MKLKIYFLKSGIIKIKIIKKVEIYHAKSIKNINKFETAH